MKIIFVLSSIHAIHSHKRIKEFIDNGFNVEIYGFSREEDIITKNERFIINLIGTFTNKLSYIKRVPIIYKGLKKVIKKVKSEDILYIFGLDIAMFLKFFHHVNYIYEEADLTYTYFNNKLLQNIFKKIDKSIIHNSVESILTSDGFVQYLFDVKKQRPSNVSIIPNKLNPNIINYPIAHKHDIDINHIRFGFVGNARFISVYNFVKIVAEKFPQHEVVLYGSFSHTLEEKFEKIIDNYVNISYRGRFENPQSLSDVYRNIDISIGTYDVTSDNVRYAEPNKLYEAIYFNIPIIVSDDTFLSKKVSQLGIGCGINALQDKSIIDFIKNINKDQIDMWTKNCSLIKKEECINSNNLFFQKLNKK